MENLTSETKISQNKIFRKHKISENLKRLLDIFQTLIVITDERKKIQFQLHYAFHQVLKKISILSGLNLVELKYLDVIEVKRMLINKNYKYWKEKAKKRISQLLYLHISDGKIMSFALGREAKTIRQKYLQKNKRVTEFRGQVGNKSKPFITKGKVRVITNTKELYKMQNKEILVTWMTSPDFVSAMRKASAIITDEGGVTCHAAIVSRELGIPAIIGTRIATQILKDGDLVEVNTNQGIVKLLKRK